MTTQNNNRYFQVSGRGNGIGITVLRRNPDTAVTGPATLTLHIFPKFWSDYVKNREEWFKKYKDKKPKDYVQVRTLPDFYNEYTSAENWHTYLYEMDILELSDDWAECLIPVVEGAQDVIDEVLKQPEELEDLEDGEIDPLWQEIARPKNFDPQPLKELTHDSRATAEFMWELLAEHNQNPSRVAGHRDFPPSSMELLPDVPALQEVFYTQFAYVAKDAIRHRKPVFLPVQEELGFVRGRMIPRGLVDRKVRGRLPVLCEYDALTTDSYIWQVIRAATQLVATSKNEGTVESAVEIDAQIRDISLVSASALLTQRVSSSDLGRMQPSLKTAYLLGRAILSHQFGAGTEDPVSEAGVIANIKYTTSGLWEKNVADYLLGYSQEYEIQEQKSLYTFYDKPEGNPVGRPKNPDIVARPKDGKKAIVFDAKYKFAKTKISQASMSDQYQLMTYSYRMGCDAFLAYPTSEEARDPDTSYLAPPGYEHKGKEHGEEEWHRIGVLALPFPTLGKEQFRLSSQHRNEIFSLKK